jgi:hypothetical protein
MSPEKEKLFELLMSELDHTNQQIRGYSDFQAKLIAVVFTVLVAIVGWVAGTSTDAQKLAYVLLAAFLVACFAILQGVFSYGLTLNYILYKHERLNCQFAELLAIEKPLGGLGYVNIAAGNRAANFAASTVGGLLLVGAVMLWVTAAISLRRSGLPISAAGAVLLGFTARSHYLLKRAIDTLREVRNPEEYDPRCRAVQAAPRPSHPT